MVFVALCWGAPKGLTGSRSGFKASQKTVPLLKVSSDRLGELGKKLGTPGYKASDIQYTMANECHAIGLPIKLT